MERENAEPTPAISLPKGGGAIKGIGETFQPNLFTGTGNFSIPIYTSPRRDDFGPKLNLQYSSGNGNGSFGVGWQLSIPRITRKTEKGLPRYQDIDVFVMSGAEDLVQVLNENGEPINIPDQGDYVITRYRPRTEGLFARIEYWRHTSNRDDIFWRVTTKENITNIYGKSMTARIADPHESTRIYEWLLEETFDAKGNHVRYEYIQENPDLIVDSIHERNRCPTQIYLRRILYGNTPDDLEESKKVGPVRTATDHTDLTNTKTRHYVFEVVFDYFDLPDLVAPGDNWRQHDEVHVIPNSWPSRPDPFSTFRSGFEIRTLRRCRRVLMLHHFNEGELVDAPLVKSTDFDYILNPDTKLTFLASATVQGYRKDPDNANLYLFRDMPPVTFKYSAFEPEKQTFQSVSFKDNDWPPIALTDPNTTLMDMFGDGLPDIVQSTEGGMYFWENPGSASFDRRRPQHGAQPPVVMAQENVAIGDMGGDGLVDLVVDAPPMSGFYEATPDGQWKTFKRFDSMPSFNLADPNTRLVDLTGDGLSDVLVTDDDAFVWFRAKGEAGFAEPERIPRLHDLEEFPDVFFSDPRVRLADLSGDGLNDIVLVHDGRVDYWPNLGYGKFGRRLTMSNTPRIGYDYDPKRLFLVDLDGSGTADLVYVDLDHVRFWFNQLGNSWSDEQVIQGTPYVTDITSIQFVDFFGSGTASLVWSYNYGAVAGSNYKVLDFCGGIKPNLLIEMDNNMGATTRAQYAPSTKFYLEDKRNGQPWVSTLPFPVQLLEKTEVIDHISKTKLTTTYKYHHGYYDGREREFRGFGRVDQYDTEEFDIFSNAGLHENSAAFTNRDKAYHVPPVLTKNWFHTGIYFDNDRRSADGEAYDRQDMLAAYRREYYQGDPRAFHLADNVVPVTETPHEAYRTLRGTLLRSEIYALDGTEQSKRPYTMSETRYKVKELQARHSNNHAVYFNLNKESITYHYERNREDPRIHQTLTLSSDEYGNITHSVDIVYPRRPQILPRGSFTSVVQIDAIYGVGTDTLHDIYHSLASDVAGEEQERRILEFFNGVTTPEEIVARISDDPSIGSSSPRAYGVRISLARRILQARDALASDKNLPEMFDEQCATKVTYGYNRFINKDDSFNYYYISIPCETKAFEVHGLSWSWPRADEALLVPLQPFNESAFDGLNDNNDFEPFEYSPPEGLTTPVKRILDWTRNYWRTDNDPEIIDPVDQLDHRLPLGQIQPLGLSFESYQAAFNTSLLQHIFQDKHNVIDLQNEGGFYFEEEYWWVPSGRQACAPNRFYAAVQIQDPFGNLTHETPDVYALLLTSVEDPLQNRVTADNDYRVLQAFQTTDINHNRNEVCFDALGMVVGTAVKGKVNENKGDSLAEFQPDLGPEQIDDFFDASDPHDPAVILLGNATSRIIYDLDRFHLTRKANPDDSTQWEPVFAATLARETHVNDPLPPNGLKIQISFNYSDGFGREIQQKIQAEPGPMVADGPDVDPRWVGSGWTIFNNKGKPVRQYEPFFSDTHCFEFAKIVGVSPILFYDPLERVVATLHPNHTYEKVVFDPWEQETWDVNDTVLQADPKDDPDVGDFFSRLDEDEYLPTWHELRTDTDMALLRWPDTDPDSGDPIPENANIRKAEKSAAEKAAAHANTPSVAYLDTLGRIFLTIADNGLAEDGTIQKYPTRVELDIEGNQRAVIDARGNTVMQYDYDMLGNPIYQNSMDAGERWMLHNVTGNPLRSWNSRGHLIRSRYDRLQRPTHHYLKYDDGTEILTERIIYGDGDELATPEAKNLRGQIYQHYDSAGVVTNESFDFKSNLLQSSRRLDREYRPVDGYDYSMGWSPLSELSNIDEITGAAKPLLEPADPYTTSSRYDALNRPISVTAPDSSETRPTYNEANLLDHVNVRLRGVETWTPFITNINYDAKGQRTLIAYGKNVTTEYEYDPETLRLIHLKSIRTSDNRKLQELSYTYDPSGNITELRDDAQQSIYHDGEEIRPVSKYEYDPLYRLIMAGGREHASQHPNHLPDHNDFPTIQNDHPNDPQAMRNYTQQYLYDEVGNILNMIHQRGTPPGGEVVWKRCYQYATDSNRLLSTGRPTDPSNPNSPCATHYSPTPVYEAHYEYDPHGNMTKMPHLTLMQWDYKDQMQSTSRQKVNDLDCTAETTYYVYDASGQRVRKVIECYAAAGQTARRSHERIYLGGFEIYREYNGDGVTVITERETLHIMDDQQRIALVETKTIKDGLEVPEPEPLVRYQLNNHLGSSSLELDGEARVISYEEYYPYGSTSYQWANSKISQKRYRYTGKERDDETGLYYYGARYYAAWLGRWVSCDPVGIRENVNFYSYVDEKPISFLDEEGYAKKERFSSGLMQDLAESFSKEMEALIKVVPQADPNNPKFHPPAQIEFVGEPESKKALRDLKEELKNTTRSRLEEKDGGDGGKEKEGRRKRVGQSEKINARSKQKKQIKHKKPSKKLPSKHEQGLFKRGGSRVGKGAKILKGGAKAIPFIGIAAGVYAIEKALRHGEYGTATLEAIGLIPVVGDLLDAARLAPDVGSALGSGFHDLVHPDKGSLEKIAGKWVRVKELDLMGFKPGVFQITDEEGAVLMHTKKPFAVRSFD